MANQLDSRNGAHGLAAGHERDPLLGREGARQRAQQRPRAAGSTASGSNRRTAAARAAGSARSYLLARADEFHLIPLSAALAVACALAAGRERALAARAALGVVIAVVALHGLERRAGQLLHPPPLAAVPGTVASGERTSPADARALRRVLRVVRRRTPRGEPVLVAPPRFDRVRVGDPLLTVLLRRPNPTRYDVVQPGVVTTARVQREMARDLLRSRAPAVVRWVAPAARAREPNGSARPAACASSTAPSRRATAAWPATATT